MYQSSQGLVFCLLKSNQSSARRCFVRTKSEPTYNELEMPFPIHSIALFDVLLICVESIQGSLFQNCCVQSLVHGTRQLGRIKFSNPSSVVGRCWITEFIRSDKKSEVYCIFGQEIEINQLGKVRVDYSIGKLDITEFVVHAEAKLEMLFA